MTVPLKRGSQSRNEEEPPGGAALQRKTGGDLLSQALSGQVPSALRGLTALFGMGRGVSLSLLPPKSARPAARRTPASRLGEA